MHIYKVVIPSRKVDEVGQIKVWIESVLGHAPSLDNSTHFTLPTMDNPFIIRVRDTANTTALIIGASLAALLLPVFMVYWFRYSAQSEKLRAIQKVHGYRMLAIGASRSSHSSFLQPAPHKTRNPFSQILPWQQRRAHRANEIVLAELFHEKDGSGTADIHQEQLHRYVADVVTRRQYTALHCAALCNVDLEIVES